MTRSELTKIIAAFGGDGDNALHVNLMLSGGMQLNGLIWNPDASLVRLDLGNDGVTAYVALAAIEAVVKFAIT